MSWRSDDANNLASSSFLPRLWQKEESRRDRAKWRSEEVKDEEVVMPASWIRKETCESREPLAVLPASC